MPPYRDSRIYRQPAVVAMSWQCPPAPRVSASASANAVLTEGPSSPRGPAAVPCQPAVSRTGRAAVRAPSMAPWRGAVPNLGSRCHSPLIGASSRLLPWGPGLGPQSREAWFSRLPHCVAALAAGRNTGVQGQTPDSDPRPPWPRIHHPNSSRPPILDANQGVRRRATEAYSGTPQGANRRNNEELRQKRWIGVASPPGHRSRCTGVCATRRRPCGDLRQPGA